VRQGLRHAAAPSTHGPRCAAIAAGGDCPFVAKPRKGPGKQQSDGQEMLGWTWECCPSLSLRI
jgi:hypothetical protein